MNELKAVVTRDGKVVHEQELPKEGGTIEFKCHPDDDVQIQNISGEALLIDDFSITSNS